MFMSIYTNEAGEIVTSVNDRWLCVVKRRFMVAAGKAVGFSVSVMCGGIIFQMRIAQG